MMTADRTPSLTEQINEYRQVIDGTGPRREGAEAMRLWQYLAAQPIDDPIAIEAITYQPEQIAAMSRQARITLALKLLRELGLIDDLAAAFAAQERYYHDHPELAAFVDWQVTLDRYVGATGRGPVAYWHDAARRDVHAAACLLIWQWRLGEDVPVPVLRSAEGYYATERIRSNTAVPPDPNLLDRLATAARGARIRGDLRLDHEHLVNRLLNVSSGSAKFQA